MNRLARLDVDDQLRWLVLRARRLDLGVDLRLVEAQGLGRLARLFLGPTAEPQQGLLVTVPEAADIAFDIAFERLVGRFHPHQQFALRPYGGTGNPKNQAPA